MRLVQGSLALSKLRHGSTPTIDPSSSCISLLPGQTRPEGPYLPHIAHRPAPGTVSNHDDPRHRPRPPGQTPGSRSPSQASLHALHHSNTPATHASNLPKLNPRLLLRLRQASSLLPATG